MTNSDTSTGLAVDQSNNSLYVDGVDGIGDIGFYTFSGPARCVVGNSQSCDPSEAFGGAKLHGAQGLGVDASNGVVYAASTSTNNVAVFGTEIFPDANTGIIEDPTKTSATLTGHVDPAGGPNITDCHFDYGTDTSYSLGSVPCSPSTPYSSSTDVTAQITGLTSGATYHYRVVATNATGTSNGSDHAFQTEGSNVSHALSGYIGTASSNPPDPYPLSGPTDVGIDQTTHDFYVTDPGNHRVEKFDSAGNFILMFGKGRRSDKRRRRLHRGIGRYLPSRYLDCERRWFHHPHLSRG